VLLKRRALVIATVHSCACRGPCGRLAGPAAVGALLLDVEQLDVLDVLDLFELREQVDLHDVLDAGRRRTCSSWFT
jgi:hypothetical protein